MRKEILEKIYQEYERQIKGEPVSDKIQEFYESYINTLSPVPISRCPFTGQILSYLMDIEGIDGPWWSYHYPVRPDFDLPESFFSLTGAMELHQPVEPVPFLVNVGPGKPYVLPRLLAYNQILAVISCVSIGPHKAYPIVYYAQGRPLTIHRGNPWGSEDFLIEEDLKLTPEELIARLKESQPDIPDFDLRPWIRSGKLLWIEPGDTGLILHSTFPDCPYQDLTGTEQDQYVQEGEVWTQEMEPEEIFMEEYTDIEENSMINSGLSQERSSSND